MIKFYDEDSFVREEDFWLQNQIPIKPGDDQPFENNQYIPQLITTVSLMTIVSRI